MSNRDPNSENQESDRAFQDMEIGIPIYNFKFGQQVGSSNGGSGSFVGRKKQLRQLKSILKDADHGAYLIAGNRGNGKTSFVNEAVNEFKKTYKEDTLKVTPNRYQQVVKNLNNFFLKDQFESIVLVLYIILCAILLLFIRSFDMTMSSSVKPLLFVACISIFLYCFIKNSDQTLLHSFIVIFLYILVVVIISFFDQLALSNLWTKSCLLAFQIAAMLPLLHCIYLYWQDIKKSTMCWSSKLI